MPPKLSNKAALGHHTKFPSLIISSVISNDSISFPAFLTDMTQTFSSNWQSEEVYGRNDPIGTFQNTVRTLSLSWDLPSATELDAKNNLYLTGRLAQFLYPGYTHTSQRAQELKERIEQPELDFLYKPLAEEPLAADITIPKVGSKEWSQQVAMRGNPLMFGPASNIFGGQPQFAKLKLPSPLEPPVPAWAAKDAPPETYLSPAAVKRLNANKAAEAAKARATAVKKIKASGALTTETMISKPPLCRIKFANIIAGVKGGLLGWVDSITITPKIESGFWGNSSKIYPKVISLSLSFNVLHEEALGFNYGVNWGKSRWPFKS